MDSSVRALRAAAGAAAFAWGVAATLSSAAPLEIAVTEKGLQSLKWNGIEYVDPSGCGQVGFTGGPSGITDTNKNRSPFAVTPSGASVRESTVTVSYPWGALSVTYGVKGADLDVRAVVTNTSPHAIAWWKANLFQLNSRLVFDESGRNMHWDYHRDRFGGAEPYAHWNFADPHVYWWNDGGTKILFADLDPKWETGVYRVKTDAGDRWVAAVSSDGDANGTGAKVPPGGRDTAHVALRFRSVLDSDLTVAADAYGAFGRANPLQYRWTDRRPIGTFFVAESAKGWPSNPNGWFNDPTVDVTTDAGREAFASRLLDHVDGTVAILKDADAQGVIWWDVEGARNPHPITYIGDPRVLDPKHPQHDKYAPELDTPVTHAGKTMPVVDACFAKFRDAGLQVGVTVRPQELAWNGSAPVQKGCNTPNAQTLPKVEYARERWGCRLFYVDSVADWFACWWYDSVTKKYNDVLILPEWARTRTFVNSAPFSYTGFTGWYRGAPPEVKACWPNAFICMSNYDLDSANGRENALHAVQQGNVLMFNCWYRYPALETMKKICALSGARHTPVAVDRRESAMKNAPVQFRLGGTDEDGDALQYALLEQPRHGVAEKLDPETGSVTYRPEPDFTGDDSFTFKATDASGLDSNRATVTLRVTEGGAEKADDLEDLMP
jgi:hypothetical protein